MSVTRYRRGLLPGSYDPVTVGHMDIIRRACSLCDEVLVGVFINPTKKGYFTVGQRVAFLQKACASLPTVRVVHSDGYVADYAKKNGCDIIIKGFRDDRDLTYEKPQACYALSHGGTPTLLLPAAPALAGISSSEVRRRLRDGEPLLGWVPYAILTEIGVANTPPRP